MRKTLIKSRVNRPLTMTSANGRWESVPTPVASAAGNSPNAATNAVIMIGTQAQDRAFADGLVEGSAAAAQLVDVGDVDDGRQHRDAEQAPESRCPKRPKTACRVDPKRHDAAHRRRQHHAEHRDERKLEIAVEREQQQENQEQRQRQNDAQLPARSGVFRIFAAPIQPVALRQAAPCC